MPDSTADNNNQQIYKPTGLTNTKFSVRNSTLLFETGTKNQYKSSKVTFSIGLNSQYTGLRDNEVSVRWSIAPHYGDNIVKCFDVGYYIATGKTRIRYEHQHPEYTNALAVGGTPGEPITEPRVFSKLMFVKLDLPNNNETVFQVAQQQQEPGDSNSSSWKELFHYVDRDHYVDEYPIGAQIAIKVKDPTDNIILKDIVVEEIELNQIL